MLSAHWLIVSEPEFDTSKIGIGIGVSLAVMSCCTCMRRCCCGKKSSKKDTSETPDAEPAVHYHEVTAFCIKPPWHFCVCVYNSVKLAFLLLILRAPILCLLNSNCSMTGSLLDRGQSTWARPLTKTTPLRPLTLRLARWLVCLQFIEITRLFLFIFSPLLMRVCCFTLQIHNPPMNVPPSYSEVWPAACISLSMQAHSNTW